MSFIFYIIIFIITSLLAVQIYARINAILCPLKRIPGRYMTSALFGNFLEFVQQDCSLLNFAMEDRRNYGTIRTAFMFFGRRKLVITDTYWIRHVLITNCKNYKRSEFPGVENIFLAVGENGLIVVDGEIHKRLRKLTSPAFKLSQLKKFMPIIESCGERMVKLFRTVCNQNQQVYDCNGSKSTEIFVKEILNKTTLDIIGLIAFGHDFEEACSFEKDTFGCHLRDWMDNGMNLTLFSIIPCLKSFMKFGITLTKFLPDCLLKGPLKRAHMTNLIHKFIEKIVQFKIEEMRKEMSNNKNSSKSLLHFILDASESNEVCQKELHDLLMTFLIAGHETSTLAITWTLYLLSKHPEYQEKCRKEVKKFFEDKKGNVDWDDVGKLSFMNAVVHESLRLYPPVPWIPRCSIGSDEISGYTIPANSEVLLITSELQRNPDNWTNPEDFLPERFLEAHNTIPWEAFMPFGDGIHKCIGYQLALTEIIYLVGILLKNFEYSIDTSIEYRDFVIITMHPKPAMKLYVKVLS